ncbi:MAG TPA: FkbM family methyltransferase [Casimicrobiaceae bacterium]
MAHDIKLALRPGSWDATIVEHLLRGEYGTLDVRGKVVVDIGAHIGAFSIHAVKQGARRVLAYEPAAENFRLLSINAAPYPEIESHRAAVWRSDRHDPVLAWRASANAHNTGGGTVLDCASICGDPLGAGEREDVATVAFDDVVERAGTIGLLKIDAEGSEYPILATSRRLDRVEAMVGEWHDVADVDPSMAVPGLDAWTGDALLDLLEDRGFVVETRGRGVAGIFRATRR